MESDIEVAVPARAYVAEGPLWDGETQTLIWVDILDGHIHRFDPSTGADSSVRVDTHVGAAVTTAGPQLLLAVTDGFALLDEATAALTEIAVVDPRPTHRMNDGTVDSRGRFWAGTMGYEPKLGTAALFRLDTDFSTQVMISGVGLSNGLGWSPADDAFYYVDSVTQTIRSYSWDPDTGTISNAKVLVDVPDSDGAPDGLAVDVDGCLWVAMFGGGSVHRYTPDGRLDRRLDLPTRGITCVEFGGAELSTLYITTATYGMSPQELDSDPLAGFVFAAEVGAQGLPAHAFAGDVTPLLASG
jgi:sugar lactone lactonase YvrE